MSHPRHHAKSDPDRAAIIMSDTGATLTYGALEHRANQGAHVLRARGLANGDTMAVWLHNCAEYLEIYWAAQRAGLHITPLSTALTGEEAQYILENSGARLLVTTSDLGERLTGLTPAALGEKLTLDSWVKARETQSAQPIHDEQAGFHMVYSSGTTGRPKGIRQPFVGGDPIAPHMLAERIAATYAIGPSTHYLSPAPLYHTAPLAYSTSVHRLGGTVIIMPKFEPEDALAAIENYRVTVTQMVPTMFVRILKLPESTRLRYDMSSLIHVIHAAAPCPVEIKRQMIDWLGPIVDEYYAGSEGNGSTGITAIEWLKKPGSVGKATWGALHICDDAGNELAIGEHGTIFFEGGWDFKYLGDEEKTRASRHPLHPDWSMLGDVGYVDEYGYLFLTDRKHHMIISGGVNIYPQEVENLLIVHPKVADAAVIGVPNAEMGEEVRAVVQPLDWADATPAFAAELLAYCRAHLSAVKCPRAVDFDPALPRLDNGKLYKRLLKDRYWAE